MGRKSTASLVFPVGGVDRSRGEQSQPPFTTQDALNVRPRDSIEGRLRGGSRPGLSKYAPVPIGCTRVTGTMVGQPATGGVTTVVTVDPTFHTSMAGSDSIHWSESGTYPIISYSNVRQVVVAGDAGAEDGAFAIERSMQVWYFYHAATGTHYFIADYGSFTDYAVGDTITMTASGTSYTIATLPSTSSYLATVASEPADEDKALQAATLSTTGTSASTTYVGATQGNSIVTATAAIFVAGMVGGYIAFDGDGAQYSEDGGRYEIVGFNDTTHIVIHGDATGEGTGDTFTVWYDPQPVRMLATAPFSRTVASSITTYWEDSFTHTPAIPYPTLSEPWESAGWATYKPVMVSGRYISATTTDAESAAIAPDLSISATDVHYIQLAITAFGGGHYGTYRIYACMADLDIAETALAGGAFDGIVLEVTFNGATYSGSVKEYKTGAVANTWNFSAGSVTTAGTNIKLQINGTTKVVRWSVGNVWLGNKTATNAFAGTRWGLGISQLGTGYDTYALVNSAYVSYSTSYDTYGGPARRVAVASAGGQLYRTDPDTPTDFEYVNVTPNLNSDRAIMATEHLAKLYIADCGDTKASGTNGTIAGAGLTFDSADFANWTTVLTLAASGDKNNHVIHITSADDSAVIGWHAMTTIAADNITLSASAGAATAGSCHFYIERAPKVYDPSAGTLAIWTASGSTQVPYGCPLICTYRDRIVLAGSPHAPSEWYMSAQGDPNDWDYTDGSAGTPIAATNSDAGQLGQPITAMIPHSDDYLIFGGLSTLWVLRGDPTYGGTLDNLSNSVGIVGKTAWCRGPSAELIFLSRDGLYMLPPGTTAYPQSISRTKLPDELLNLSDESMDIQLVYNPNERGVHIWLTGIEESSRRHWWYDWDTGGFWPVAYFTDHEPTSSLAYVADISAASGILTGCRDGYIRFVDRGSPGDDGRAMDAHVFYGPMMLGTNEERVGILKTLASSLDGDSSDVDWSVFVGDTAEEALESTAFATGTWVAGHNNRSLVRARGVLYYLLLSAKNNEPWAVEWISTTKETRGNVR